MKLASGMQGFMLIIINILLKRFNLSKKRICKEMPTGCILPGRAHPDIFIDEKIKENIDKILEMFETGNMPAAIARTVIRAQEGFELPSDKWSLGNQIIMMAHNTEDARGFKQWQEVGRFVKKGAKAFYILGPMCKRIKNKEDDREKIIITCFKSIPVFRYEDTEGAEVEYPDYLPKEPPPLWDVAEKMGIQVNYRPFTGEAFGSITTDGRKMTLRTHDVKTYFHELGHGAHGTFKKLKGGQHEDQEIVAETVACVLCELYGYHGYIYHGFRYIKHYAGAKDGKESARAIMAVLSDVKQCLDIILSLAEPLEELTAA
ncbi:ArdC-like ssDNA-binding domain-containing protein [Desulforamulus reducens]|uniref:ArdC-like ssDNA-binding domain-containing protein n=1 Tax=Desulforamulus reducens TaxID=59610 RepID=UPI0002D74DDC|nr:M48 family peptidase [Desulforamulus reducens]